MMGSSSGANKRQRNQIERRNEDGHSVDTNVHTDESDEETGDEETGNDGSRKVTGGATAMKLAGMGSSKSLKEVQHMMVKRTVSKNTLLYCPFVNSTRELACDRPFAQITMGFLGKKKLSNEEKNSFWEEYKSTAHKALNVKRSNITGQLRKRFVGK